MKVVRTPQSLCRAAMRRVDITPPIGIYHRMWGAALHDRATGVHRPLEATVLYLEPIDAPGDQAQVLIAIDHCILDTQELHSIRRAVQKAASVGFENVMIALSHTHGAGWMSRSRSQLPGGELLAPYLDELPERLAVLACDARDHAEPATLVYGTGRCQLAAHRDYFDSDRGQFVCGFDPQGVADDTLLVARIISRAGKPMGTLINYACHPTTLAWDNTLISPDWVGAMREVIEKVEGTLCLFLQGASGDLGPREGFVGDPQVADRNGRQVGYAALATLAGLPPPATEYRYSGAVISGTAIGTWRHEQVDKESLSQHARWQWDELVVPLPYRHDLPTKEQTQSERDWWLQEESIARNSNDLLRIRECRAHVEQRTRQLNRLDHLAPGRCFPLTLRIGLLGDAIWIMVPGELYQVFQKTLRARFAHHPVVISTLTNDWQPGYIPPANRYGYEIYQEVIAATSAGSLEILIEAIQRRVSELLNQPLSINAS